MDKGSITLQEPLPALACELFIVLLVPEGRRGSYLPRSSRIRQVTASARPTVAISLVATPGPLQEAHRPSGAGTPFGLRARTSSRTGVTAGRPVMSLTRMPARSAPARAVARSARRQARPLLKQLTKTVLGTALNQELIGHLGHDRRGPVSNAAGSVRTGSGPRRC
jgi:hypothetical protein